MRKVKGSTATWQRDKQEEGGGEGRGGRRTEARQYLLISPTRQRSSPFLLTPTVAQPIWIR